MMDLILLQAEGAVAGGQWSFWIMMLLIFVVFYFFMIRPQTKKQKEKDQQRFIQKGDKVVTDGGLYGYVVEVKDNVLIVVITNGIKIKVQKDSVKLVEKTEYAPIQEIVCPQCGKSYDAKFEFCPHCGGKQEKECPTCHKKDLPAEAEFCPECGTKL